MNKDPIEKAGDATSMYCIIYEEKDFFLQINFT